MMIVKTKLLVASTNKKKLKELQALLLDLEIEIAGLSDFSGIQTVEESGKTFGENATLKAIGYAKQTGLLTLAEDSGLCCDALEGAPGVYSARFSEEGTDEENNAKLLRLMEKMPDNCRSAYYHSAVVIARPDGTVVGTAEGKVHGYIIRESRGEEGFGYDPVFYYPPFEKTFGQVPAEMKHGVSHRAKALEKAKLVLSDYLKQNQVS